jgi:signal transduction histidine kinase
VKVAATWDAGREQVTIAVTDSGIGIAKKDQDVIFEDSGRPTTRRPAATRRRLGLAICRRLATMLDGELAVRSAPGAGSTFTLTMPLMRKGE